MDPQNDNGRSNKRGFAAMNEEEQRRIASMGGKAAHESGKAHQWTPEEAARAGSMGGKKRSRQGSQGERPSGFAALDEGII